MDPNQMMGRNFPVWIPPVAAPAPSEGLAAAAPPQPFLPPPNRGWKRKNPNPPAGYQPPALGDLQVQNRAKARRWFKNPNQSSNHHHNNNRKHFFPKKANNKAAAPRNTTSFIIRAKRSGGIASLVSPCPVTPAVLPTPRLSPSREGLADMAQAQWGVDGYGSMKGLIRLRSSQQPASPNASDDDDDANSSGSDVEEHLEVERRLDQDLSRFEMVYPARGEDVGGYMFEDDDDYDQDAHVARLEEENLTLKERLFLVEQEMGDMRRRLEALEARFSLSDTVQGAGGRVNAIEEAPPQTNAGMENNNKDIVEQLDMGSQKKRARAIGPEDIGEIDVAKGPVGSDMKQHDIGKGVMDSVESREHNAEVVCMDTEKRCNVEKVAVDLEKGDEHNAEKVAVYSEKEDEHCHNADKVAMDSEKDGEHNADKVAVDSEKGDEHNADKVAVDSEKVVVVSEKGDKHNAEKVALDSEMIDSA